MPYQRAALFSTCSMSAIYNTRRSIPRKKLGGAPVLNSTTGRGSSPLPIKIEDLDIFQVVADQRGVVGALGATDAGGDFDLESAASNIAQLVEQIDDWTNLRDLRDSLINAAMA